MAKNEQSREVNQPVWFDGKHINEALFCDDFLIRHKIIYTNGAFFTPDGRVTDDLPLRSEIFDELRCCAVSNIPRKISNIVELMKLAALVEDFPPETDRIHLANGTLFLDGTFTEGRPEIVRCRLPVAYNPDAPTPTRWLAFLDGLLYPEDIPTLQEYIGYCLIPSNKGQRMMVIKGSGGEGKSQIGAVLSALFGSNMKDGSIGKISENRFARADLEHILLCVDDDMRMEALRQTNYVKSIVTAQGKMDLERKGKQSYQGWMCARLLAFSNGDLQALFDRSDGFYRRQLVLTTKEKPADRVDDPDLAEKMKAEVEGILLWAFEGLQRLVANNFKFTESQRTRENREAVKRDNNNVFDFLESEGYIRLKADASISSKELYEAYQIYCAENNLTTMKPRSFSDAVIASQSRYNLEYCNNVTNAAGRKGDFAFQFCSGGSTVPLLFDDLQAGEILPFLFFQHLGDVLDGGGELGDHDVVQGVGALLGLLNGHSQAIDTALHLSQFHCEALNLAEFQIHFIQLAVGGIQPIVKAGGAFLHFNNGKLHAHDAAVVQLEAGLHRHCLCELTHHAQGDVCTLQSLISRRVGGGDLVLDDRRPVDQLHHFPHEDVPLAVHQVIALAGKRKAALLHHQVRFCGKNLCHTAASSLLRLTF